MEAKYNRMKYAAEIKILAASKVVLESSGRNIAANVPRKKKGRTGILPARKQQGKKNPKNKSSQCYCVLYKKYGMPDLK